MENKNNTLDYVRKIAISLLAGYFITLVGIFVLALMLLFFQITEEAVNIGVIVIYVLSSFGAGVLAGKQLKTRKFIWGMIAGSIYYLILILMSVIANHSLAAQGQELITTFILCFGSGTLGGMVS